MIGQIAGGMITLMLAKLVLNDVPHSIGLTKGLQRGEYLVAVGRVMVGSDVIPGYYTTSQIPAKIQELMVAAPSDLEAITIFAPENEDMLLGEEDLSVFGRLGPILPTVPPLRDKAVLWSVDIQGGMGGEAVGVVRAFLVPRLVANYLHEVKGNSVMVVSRYEEGY